VRRGWLILVIGMLSLPACGYFDDGGTNAQTCSGPTQIAVTGNAGNKGDGRGSSVFVTDTKTASYRVTGDRIAGQPSFSPDGSRLVTTLDLTDTENPDTALSIVGTNDHTDAAIPGTTGGQDPDWSPDGRTIAYAGARWSAGSVGAGELHIIDAPHGTNNQVIVSAPGAQIRSPSWSPDGTHLAFLEVQNTQTLAPSTSAWITDPTGTQTRRLSSVSATSHLDWSPDGRSLLLSSAPIGSTELVNVRTAKTQTIGRDQLFAAWGRTEGAVYWYERTSPSAGTWSLAEGALKDGKLQRTRFVPNVSGHFVYALFGIAAAPCTPD
jgi:Tol biopolymer transport system component